MRTRYLNGLLIVASLVISTSPLYAQRQQQNVAKLKADARNIVGIIGGDKAKTQAYCEIVDLGRQLEQADKEKDRKKTRVLSQKIYQLQKQIGPEFVVLANILKNVDLNSPDGREIALTIQPETGSTTSDQNCQKLSSGGNVCKPNIGHRRKIVLRKMFITLVAILALGLGSSARAFAKHGSGHGGGHSTRHAARHGGGYGGGGYGGGGYGGGGYIGGGPDGM